MAGVKTKSAVAKTNRAIVKMKSVIVKTNIAIVKTKSVIAIIKLAYFQNTNAVVCLIREVAYYKLAVQRNTKKVVRFTDGILNMKK